jgi:N-acetylglucosamine-6-phosphate deacetylase
MQLLIKNGLILQNNGIFLKGHIGIDRGKIAALWYNGLPPLCENEIDAEHYLISPGFIDTHNHGGNGFGYDCTEAEWEKMAERLASAGVTSVLPTLESSNAAETLAFIDNVIALAKNNNINKVAIAGIHLEGPYLNTKRKGMHQEQYIRPADNDEIKRILERADGLIRIWSIAPEVEGNMAAIKTLADAGISVSVAHTEADYPTAMTAFAAGANRVTHTFNAMPALHQRYQGIVTAAWQHGAFLELIADGHHVSPTIIKMLVAASDPGKVVLVSDNNECSGLPDGSYTVRNRQLIVVEGQLKDESGTLAGTVVGLNQCALTLTHCGISTGAALKMASENPARSIGIFDRKGSIAAGKDADLVLLNGQFDVMMTIKAGQIVYRYPTAR